jgi:single-strand DNA-binding protein
MNAVQLCGRLTRDAELRQVGQNQTWLAKFGLAVDTPTGKDSETAFVDVTAWGSVAERCGELRKGDAVFVAGKLRTESWEDRQTGAKRTKLGVVAEIVGPGLLRHESKRAPAARDHREQSQTYGDAEPAAVGAGAPPNDEVPF